MTREEFMPGMLAELRLLCQPFDHVALEQFGASCWTLIEEDPAPSHWAREFLASTATPPRVLGQGEPVEVL